jgi:hypothetical protein
MREREFRKLGNSFYLKLEPADITDLNIDIKKDKADLDSLKIIKGKKK